MKVLEKEETRKELAGQKMTSIPSSLEKAGATLNRVERASAGLEMDLHLQPVSA